MKSDNSYYLAFDALCAKNAEFGRIVLEHDLLDEAAGALLYSSVTLFMLVYPTLTALEAQPRFKDRFDSLLRLIPKEDANQFLERTMNYRFIIPDSYFRYLSAQGFNWSQRSCIDVIHAVPLHTSDESRHFGKRVDERNVQHYAISLLTLLWKEGVLNVPDVAHPSNLDEFTLKHYCKIFRYWKALAFGLQHPICPPDLALMGRLLLTMPHRVADYILAGVGVSPPRYLHEALRLIIETQHLSNDLVVATLKEPFLNDPRQLARLSRVLEGL
jgi:hypothetical protein